MLFFNVQVNIQPLSFITENLKRTVIVNYWQSLTSVLAVIPSTELLYYIIKLSYIPSISTNPLPSYKMYFVIQSPIWQSRETTNRQMLSIHSNAVHNNFQGNKNNNTTSNVYIKLCIKLIISHWKNYQASSAKEI